MAFQPLTVKELILRIEEAAGSAAGRMRCPVCSAYSWSVGSAIVTLPAIRPDDPGTGFPVLPITCGLCGYVRFHAADVFSDA